MQTWSPSVDPHASRAISPGARGTRRSEIAKGRGRLRIGRTRAVSQKTHRWGASSLGSTNMEGKRGARLENEDTCLGHTSQVCEWMERVCGSLERFCGSLDAIPPPFCKGFYSSTHFWTTPHLHSRWLVHATNPRPDVNLASASNFVSCRPAEPEPASMVAELRSFCCSFLLEENEHCSRPEIASLEQQSLIMCVLWLKLAQMPERLL